MNARHPGFAFSALERTPAAGHTPRHDRIPARWPWWLDPLALVSLTVVLAYRVLVPVAWRRRCIYSPTCSAYGVAVLKRYGGRRGLGLTIERLRRCDGSQHVGGEDPP